MDGSDDETKRNQPSRGFREGAFESFLSAKILEQRSRYQSAPYPGSSRAKTHRGRALALLVLVGLTMVFSGGVFLAESSCWGSGSRIGHSTGPHRVALVDQLSLEDPDPGFVRNVNSSVAGAGLAFDYYPPAKATVDFFTKFPTLGYSIVILRTHGAGLVSTDPTVITTSEEYSQSHRVTDQLLNRLTSINVNGTRFFALTPDFITSAMCGRFPGTLILTMFCEGAQLISLARAFVEKGAGAYVGWNGVVTVSHTDTVFESLVRVLLQGKTLASSVQNVTTAWGPDPVYGSHLLYYPESQGALSL